MFTLLFILAAAAILWWAFNSLPLPPVIKTVVAALLALMLLFWLWKSFPMGTVGG
jgi:hypothetical protein